MILQNLLCIFLYTTIIIAKLRPLTLSDCGKVTKNDSKILNETGGVFDIYPTYSKLEVFCDLETDGGGWMVRMYINVETIELFITYF